MDLKDYWMTKNNHDMKGTNTLLFSFARETFSFMKGDDYYAIIYNVIMYLFGIGIVNFYRRVGIPYSIWRHNYIRTNSSMDH